MGAGIGSTVLLIMLTCCPNAARSFPTNFYLLLSFLQWPRGNHVGGRNNSGSLYDADDVCHANGDRLHSVHGNLIRASYSSDRLRNCGGHFPLEGTLYGIQLRRSRAFQPVYRNGHAAHHGRLQPAVRHLCGRLHIWSPDTIPGHYQPVPLRSQHNELVR
ncbi:uncharacterized protein LOC144107865 isoform X1 [Amblyomma americanum]